MTLYKWCTTTSQSGLELSWLSFCEWASPLLCVKFDFVFRLTTVETCFLEMQILILRLFFFYCQFKYIKLSAWFTRKKITAATNVFLFMKRAPRRWWIACEHKRCLAASFFHSFKCRFSLYFKTTKKSLITLYLQIIFRTCFGVAVVRVRRLLSPSLSFCFIKRPRDRRQGFGLFMFKEISSFDFFFYENNRWL